MTARAGRSLLPRFVLPVGAGEAAERQVGCCAMLQRMQVIRATVRNGRIVVDEPTTLPDGHEVALGVLNDDGMSEAERRRLYASITRGIRDGQAGREMDFDSFLDQLDAEP